MSYDHILEFRWIKFLKFLDFEKKINFLFERILGIPNWNCNENF